MHAEAESGTIAVINSQTQNGSRWRFGVGVARWSGSATSLVSAGIGDRLRMSAAAHVNSARPSVRR